MGLEDYERPATLIGLHGSHTNIATFDRPKWLEIVKSLCPGWYKIVDTENAGQKQWAKMLRGEGITPIVRPYQPTCSPISEATLGYIDEGITPWIEQYNEPNIDRGWAGNECLKYGDDLLRAEPESVMRLVAELVLIWLREAERIINRGGYPAFPSMAECGVHPTCSSIKWYKLLFEYMGQHHRDRARAIFQSGAWLAVHDATLNRFWKDESGEYHFEHPYSELVSDHLGWDPTLWDDDCSLIGHQVPVFLMKKHLGSDIEVPVISTEGGIFGGLIGKIPDGAYPAFDEAEHARATVAMFRWLERYQKTYPWYFGMCPWKFAPFGWQADAWPNDNWIKKGGQRLAVVGAVSAMGSPDPNVEPLGPIGLFKEESGDMDLEISVSGMIDLRATIQTHPTKKYNRRGIDTIKSVALHHIGVTWPCAPESTARYHVESLGWPGVGYHFQIQRDGTIYWLNSLEAISYHVGGVNNVSAIGICFEGDLRSQPPTELQTQSGARLIKGITQAVARELSLLGHREYPDTSTVCPGLNDADLVRWKVALVPSGPIEDPELIALRKKHKSLCNAAIAARNTLDAELSKEKENES